MAVEKFRSHDEARKALQRRDGGLAERIEALWSRSERLTTPWRSPGLFKFRSIEDAHHHREEMIRDRVGRLRDSRNPEASDDADL